MVRRLAVLALLCLASLQAIAAVVGVSSAVNETSGTSVSVTRSVTAGNYLLAYAVNSGADTNITFSTTAGSTGSWTEIAGADQYNGTDQLGQEAAYAVVNATGSVTVQASLSASRLDKYIILVELSGVTGFDAHQYARDTAAPWETASRSNTNAAATRVVTGLWWDGGTGASQSPYTDNGTVFGASAFGAFGRVQSIVESSVIGRTGAFAAGTGASPAHINQFIFNDVTASSVNIPAIYRHLRRMKQ